MPSSVKEEVRLERWLVVLSRGNHERKTYCDAADENDACVQAYQDWQNEFQGSVKDPKLISVEKV
jgi:hypothetical protein